MAAERTPNGKRRLTVAVTGPTGEIGLSFLRALEAASEVGEIRGMARRPFDPATRGWRKTRYVRGDVLDREAVERFVAGADVVVHLAFLIFGDREQAREVNLTGSRNVFESAVSAGSERLVYTSSVAAYGFHAENPQPLSEDVPTAGSDELYYSAQKAELEKTLAESIEGSDVQPYVFRPSIVGGPDSPALVKSTPYVSALSSLPAPLRRLVGNIPTPPPLLVDPGTPIQLVHADDVAAALLAAVLGAGAPNVYNLAAEGTITVADVARELGWRSVPIPHGAVDLTAALVARVPGLPSQTEWIQAVRIPVVMDTTRARRELGWQPRHDVHETLRATVAGARENGIIR